MTKHRVPLRQSGRRAKPGKLTETACTEAIAIFPNRWTAINSRGTTYFAARRFDEALIDYRRALEVAPQDTPASETIAQNIRLTEQRIAAQN